MKKQTTFKERLRDIKTWGQGQELVKTLSGDELIKFRDALIIVNDNFGLTMRDEFMLSLIKIRIDVLATLNEPEKLVHSQFKQESQEGQDLYDHFGATE